MKNGEIKNVFLKQGFGKTRLEMKIPITPRPTLILAMLLTALGLSGCSGGLRASNSSESTTTPTLSGCNGCDIAGKGGSLYLMKTGDVIGSMAIGLPADKWSSGCINGAGSSRINYLVLSTTSEAYIIGRIYSATGCDEADLDMVKTQRYWFSSLGSASVSFDANTLRTQLAQVWEEPHSTSTVNDINTRCDGVAGTATMGVARDTSICLSDNGSGNPYAIAIDDTSTLFWTDGNTLKLGSTSGLATAGTDGYFSR